MNVDTITRTAYRLTAHCHNRNFLSVFLGGIGLVIGFLFAALLPVDGLMAGNNTYRSIFLFLSGTLLGKALAPKIGFTTGIKFQRFYASTIIASAFLVTLFVLIVDAILFRSVLPARYVDGFLHEPMAERLILYCARAFYESLMYRFFLGTILTWCFSRFLRLSGPVPLIITIVAMLLAQMINITANVLIPLWPEATPMLILWMIVRFVIPGTFWGFLYYRNGLVASEYAASITHVFLQPVIALALTTTM